MRKNNEDLNELLRKNFRLLFKLDLAFESYEDDTGDNIPLLKETTIELNNFRKEKKDMPIDQQMKLSEKILKKYNQVLDLVGRDNFIFYEDGDINYKWNGGKNDGQRK